MLLSCFLLCKKEKKVGSLLRNIDFQVSFFFVSFPYFPLPGRSLCEFTALDHCAAPSGVATRSLVCLTQPPSPPDRQHYGVHQSCWGEGAAEGQQDGRGGAGEARGYAEECGTDGVEGSEEQH